MSKTKTPALSTDNVILRIRGHAVILDSDLATLYGVNKKTQRASKA